MIIRLSTKKMENPTSTKRRAVAAESPGLSAIRPWMALRSAKEQRFRESGFTRAVIAKEGNVLNFIRLIYFHDI